MNKITAPDIMDMKRRGLKIPVLTAYTYPIARLLDSGGIPIILVGDSVGMVEAGMASTLPVTMEEMLYHTRAVARASKNALVVADMPFMSYQASVEEAVRNAGRLVKEGGAEAIKIEGGGEHSRRVIKAISSADIPVMAHIGLTPQSVHKLGGYKVQGRGKKEGMGLLKDARAAEAAGAFSLVLECVPAGLARRVTLTLKIPTIGIGAGSGCDGQVLVINDMLGMGVGERKLPRFVKKYADLDSVIENAVRQYKKDVEEGDFPSKEHSY